MDWNAWGGIAAETPQEIVTCRVELRQNGVERRWARSNAERAIIIYDSVLLAFCYYSIVLNDKIVQCSGLSSRPV